MLYDCPECALPCAVESRGSLASTNGPLELAEVVCVAGHGFLMPTEGSGRHPATTVLLSDKPMARPLRPS